MKKYIFLLLVVFVVFGSHYSVYADFINGTVKDTIFEARKGEFFIAEMSDMGAVGNKLVSVDIRVYGIALLEEPVEWKDHSSQMYFDVVIENSRGVTINNRAIISAINMAHYNTLDGKFQKRKVTRLVIK